LRGRCRKNMLPLYAKHGASTSERPPGLAHGRPVFY
jgi:hypothetical protein